LFVGRDAGGLRVAHGMAAMVCYDEDNQLVPLDGIAACSLPGRGRCLRPVFMLTSSSVHDWRRPVSACSIGAPCRGARVMITKRVRIEGDDIATQLRLRCIWQSAFSGSRLTGENDCSGVLERSLPGKTMLGKNVFLEDAFA
jgi:hypothetical protein